MKYYTIQELSDLLKSPCSYFKKQIDKDNLKATFIGRHYIVSEDDLKLFLNTLGKRDDRKRTS